MPGTRFSSAYHMLIQIVRAVPALQRLTPADCMQSLRAETDAEGRKFHESSGD